MIGCFNIFCFVFRAAKKLRLYPLEPDENEDESDDSFVVADEVEEFESGSDQRSGSDGSDQGSGSDQSSESEESEGDDIDAKRRKEMGKQE